MNYFFFFFFFFNGRGGGGGGGRVCPIIVLCTHKQDHFVLTGRPFCTHREDHFAVPRCQSRFVKDLAKDAQCRGSGDNVEH